MNKIRKKENVFVTHWKKAFGGLVYMDFNKEYMEKNGHGIYKQLDVSLLPKLWLAYVADPDDSGKVHSKVKQRFLNGDQEVILDNYIH